MAAVAFALVCLKSLMWLIAEFSVFTVPVWRFANWITPSGAQSLPGRICGVLIALQFNPDHKKRHKAVHGAGLRQ